LQLNAPASFSALYDHLQKEKQLETITHRTLDARKRLRQRQFVEISGMADPPAIETWIRSVRELFGFIEKNLEILYPKGSGKSQASRSISKKQMHQYKGLVDFLEGYINISRRDPNKQYVRLARGSHSFAVWCGIVPAHVIIPLESTLPTDVTVVGRVDRMLESGDTHKLVDFSSFDKTTGVDKLLKALATLSPLIGHREITEADLEAVYPDIFVTPVAMYR